MRLAFYLNKRFTIILFKFFLRFTIILFKFFLNNADNFCHVKFKKSKNKILIIKIIISILSENYSPIIILEI